MTETVFFTGMILSAGGAAWLASRAEHWRDVRWVGVAAIIVFAVVLAAATGRMTST
ncbi:hypothetical protein O4220_24755 [Rhodococcus ruber]|uniref:Uncharacterized protein n=1 Tax=Rhodococcus ruber TaxID=1830 RepID=A0ABT4ML70_9NOCA|nr:hypothetical protein [Rhodococcus ruber]MCZ4521742.1 hypothetical protein [Rhodococcus ruber]